MNRKLLLLSVLSALILTGQGTVFRNPNSSPTPNPVYVTRGLNYQPQRAAFIDSAGNIGGVIGNLSDCVRVDGTSGACGTGGGGGGGVVFVDHEAPTGSVNGSNASFTLAITPTTGSLSLYRNGLLQKAGTDFTLSAAAITFSTAPGSGDWLDASYRH